MSYYSDEFFKEYGLTDSDEYKDDFEYEDVYSDSSQNQDSGYEDVYSDSRRSRDNTRQNNRSGRSPYDRQGDYRDRRDRNTNRRTVRDYDRDRDRDDRRPSRPQNDSRRPQNRRRRRRSRLFRRTMIVLSFAAVLFVLIGVIALIVSSSSVGEVQKLAASDVSANQIVLSWEKAKNASGYKVLMSKGGADFEEIQTIGDPDTLTATIPDLEQASAYSFSVVALRDKKEGKPVLTESITTLPQTPEITNSFSAKPGVMHLDWSENPKANGYIVEYKKDGGEYTADMTLTVSDPAECKADIENLEVNATYAARVCAYVDADSQLKSAPSDEVSVKIVDKETEVMPKAKDQKVDGALDVNKPMIALTFDDGPAVDQDCGDRILDVLEKYNAKATFFMLGCNAGEEPDNLKRKVSLKMEIGNHTWNHTHYGGEVTAEDVRMGSNGIYDACGQFPTCFRSPGGMTTGTILTECAAENMAVYYWSIDTQDWSSRDADAVYHAVVDNVKDGDIVLMHEIYGSTADAVERMVPELIEKGYQLVTCHDLIALKGGSEPTPGVEYVDAFRQMGQE
ncbi:MAG: polysaccharide deacetylase family protein [Ruminococcus sp.]|nr:polysaccharide deacetylase family protein [Ruminococcus sp.]